MKKYYVNLPQSSSANRVARLQQTFHTQQQAVIEVVLQQHTCYTRWRQQLLLASYNSDVRSSKVKLRNSRVTFKATGFT